MIGRVVALAAMGMTFSCGSGGSGAPEKCESFVQLACERMVACRNDGLTHADCVSMFQKERSCAKAVQVTQDYDFCMADLQGIACSVLLADGKFDLPSSCESAISYQE